MDVVPVDDLSKDCHVQILANFKDHEGAFDVRRVARLQLVRIPNGKRAHSSFRVVPIEYRIASNTNEVSESQHGQQRENTEKTLYAYLVANAPKTAGDKPNRIIVGKVDDIQVRFSEVFVRKLLFHLKRGTLSGASHGCT